MLLKNVNGCSKGCSGCDNTITVIGFKEDCEKSVRKKLLAFGVTPGCTIEIIRTAPLGDPVEIKVRGFSLSLRKKELDSLIFQEIG